MKSKKKNWRDLGIIIVMLLVLIGFLICVSVYDSKIIRDPLTMGWEVTDLEDGTVRIDYVRFDENKTILEIPETYGREKKPVSTLGENLFSPSEEDYKNGYKKTTGNGRATALVNHYHEIKIPGCLKIIEGNPFSSCHFLETIDVPDENNIFKISDGLLINSETNTVIQCPQAKQGTVEIPEGIQHIGDFAFYYSDVECVILPKTLQTIGEEAFAYCLNLEQITIPETVIEIGKDAFENCGAPILSYPYLPGSNVVYPFTIIAVSGSKAEEYAKENRYSLRIQGETESL